MTRKIGPILHEMITAINGIQGAIAGKTFADFQKDWLLRHGVQRAIEIISKRAAICQSTKGHALKHSLAQYRWHWKCTSARISCYF